MIVHSKNLSSALARSAQQICNSVLNRFGDLLTDRFAPLQLYFHHFSDFNLIQVVTDGGDRNEVLGGILSSELEVVENGYRHLNVIISSKIKQDEICEDDEKRLNCKKTFVFIEKVKEFIKL